MSFCILTGRLRCFRQGEEGWILNWRRVARNVLFLFSVGLAVHLVLPQIPGLAHSARLISTSSHLLVSIAFLCEVLSYLSYGELLGRTAGLASLRGTSPSARRRVGVGRSFTFRLTLVGNGASKVLPGGGAASAAVTYEGLRSRGFGARQIGGVVATVGTLVYAALAAISLLSLTYLLAANELGSLQSALATLALAVTALLIVTALAAYRYPATTKSLVLKLAGPPVRSVERRFPRFRLAARLEELLREVRSDIKGAVRQMRGRPFEEVKLVGLAFGYWLFDAACLVVMFWAFGVEASVVHLLVAYGIATAAGNLPITPGGIGVFETTMIATLALLGVGSEAIIPVLGYRIFNFWLPIPLAALLYPTLRAGKRRFAPKKQRQKK
ncbi:TIGR00374: TIGR00374 family protein [Rubrobacter radiotolerans]|uniref:Lysylphosphatidylglycerol synthase transmembrane domain-containing protein n=1 Tax=Rubrobacter radiotolerans TaxID=42256 RepID=A0A023X4T5_RUBRA|nr:lysylphosphatidylglycerol synthase transmembrane domain-containing protein [Rubrobacter radiotolerans]AHY47363.1 TIGR00374: TIGR00374 family protein [Rubrobacter radiotolerans]MDX5894767.1 lysylphosphatidylglycerol synthase transmembrane domain-containing protein [Rubrobacter radiotolerans]SMC06727.1 hypothetical protein SAMN00767673_2083 [Rubrobacter radiotolerans DSM 5868]